MKLRVAIFGIVMIPFLYGASQLGKNTSVTWPDLGDPAGSGQVTVVQDTITELSNDDNARYRTASAIADSTLTTFTHDFGVAFSELNILVYTGTYPSLTRVADPTASGWVIAANGGNPLTQIDVTTPGSGGPHTFALQIIQGRGAEKIDDLDDVDVSTTAPEDGQALVYDGVSAWIPGASGDSSFKCQEVVDPTLTIKPGFLKLDSGDELYIAADLDVSLDTIFGTDPVDATPYYLYLDLDSIPANALLGDGRLVRTVSLEAHFSVQTTSPDAISLVRYVPICFIRSADSGNVWSGTGAVVSTLAIRSHGRPVVNVSPTVYELSKQTVGAVGDVGQVKAGHVLTNESFPAFTNELSYYNLNADLNDDSGQARTLVDNGTIPFTGTDIFGGTGAAVMNGSSQWFSNTSVHFNPGDADFSIGLWYTPGVNAFDTIYSQGPTSADRVFMVAAHTDNLRLYATNTAGTYDSSVFLTWPNGKPTIPVFISHVYTTSDKTHRFYLDGEYFGELVQQIRSATVSELNIGTEFGTLNFSSGTFEQFYYTKQAYTASEIRKLFAAKINHGKNIVVENQEWSATFFDSNDEIINKLDNDYLVHLTPDNIYIEAGLAATDSIALRLQNQSFTTTVVPIKTFTTGKQTADPGTQTHSLGCTPKDFYVLTEGQTTAGDFDKRYDLCTADETSIACDVSSLTIDASHTLEIVGSCSPIASVVDLVTDTQMLITQDKSSGDVTVSAGQSFYRPNVEIQAGHTYDINGVWNTVGLITGAGTLTGTGTVKAIDMGQNGDTATFTGDVVIEGILSGGSPLKVKEGITDDTGIGAVTMPAGLLITDSATGDGASGNLHIGSSLGLDIDYSNSGQTTINMDQGYDSAASTWNFRTRTLGTPITAMSIKGDGKVKLYAENIGTDCSLGDLCAGVYNPTISNIVNATSVTQDGNFRFIRVANTVHISGRVLWDPDGVSNQEEASFSLPTGMRTTNFGTFVDCSGTAVGITGVAGTNEQTVWVVRSESGTTNFELVSVDLITGAGAYGLTMNIMCDINSN